MTETPAQIYPQNPPTLAGGAQARHPVSLANPTHHRRACDPLFSARSRFQKEEVG